MKGEIVPAQRRAPNIRVTITAGDFALRPDTPLEETVPDTMDGLSAAALVDIPTQEIPTQGNGHPAETATEASDAQNAQRDEPDADLDPTDADDTPDPKIKAPEGARGDVWDLVERAQEGDSEAYAEIYHRYFDTVFRFVYFRAGNRQVSEDLTAEAFLRGLRRIGSVTWQGRDLGAWFVTIARNLLADYFKSGRYRFEVATGDVLDADQHDTSPYVNPEEAVMEHITNLSLLGAVKSLNPEQRECIVLRFLKGYSVAETAAIMGKNEGAVKALQYRAVGSLRKLLPEGFTP